MISDKNSRPPKWAMAFFRWFCDPALCEEIEGDLTERFYNCSEDHGSVKSKWIFIIDVFSLLRPQIIARVDFNALNPFLAYNLFVKHMRPVLMAFIPCWIASFVLLTFMESTNCDQLVIDSYEVRSGIDIPDVAFYNCYYDEKKDVRVSVYQLKEGAERYLQTHIKDTHRFKALQLENLHLSLPLSASEMPRSAMLYQSTGTKRGNTWQYVVEKESGRLWVEMKHTSTTLIDILKFLMNMILLPLPVLVILFAVINSLKEAYLNWKKKQIYPFENIQP